MADIALSDDEVIHRDGRQDVAPAVESGEREPLFRAVVSSLAIVDILKTLLLDNNQIAICTIVPTGTRFTVERQKVSRLIAC